MAELHLVVQVKDLRLWYKKPTTVHYNGTQRFPQFEIVSVQGFGSLTAALDIGSLSASIGLRWWHRGKRGLAGVSNLIAYWKT